MASSDPKSGCLDEKELLQQARIIFTDIKSNYSEFLSSLKYQNLNDKKKTKFSKRKPQDSSGFDNWETNLNKNFSFEQEIISQNSGFTSFIRLIDNIKRLQEINSQMATCIFLQEKSSAGQEQLENAVAMLQHIEKGLLSFLQPASMNLKKETR